MELSIDDEWYATPDSQQVLIALKKIIENQEKHGEMICQMNQKINDLTQIIQHVQQEKKEYIEKKEKLEKIEKVDEKDVKKIKEMLHELTVIKEREMNALLREHIPFPFLMKQQSPLSRIPFRRPFSSNLLPKQ